MGLFLGKDDALPMVVLVVCVFVWGIDFGFGCEFSFFWREICEFLWVLLVVFPTHSLEFWRLQDSLVGEFIDTPNQSVKIDPNIVYWVFVIGTFDYLAQNIMDKCFVVEFKCETVLL